MSDEEYSYTDEETEVEEDEEEEQATAVELPELEPEMEDDESHNTVVVIANEDRISSDTVQYTETVEAIGIRASQIEHGSPVFTDVSGLSDPIKMAEKEFFDRKSPLILERKMGVKGSKIIVEHWKVREMKFPPGYDTDVGMTFNKTNEIDLDLKN